MENLNTKGFFTCPHCGFHHRVFRITCPNCGRLLVRDLSNSLADLDKREEKDKYSWQFVAKGIAALFLIWIIILLSIYVFKKLTAV
jgi:predicted RNA-binding Zn-ribbon protein involved in translation (DUF1610 family)